MSFAARLLSRRARGLAMFEVLCALGVIAAAIVGAVLLYQSVTASNARAAMVQTAMQLRGAVERAWTGQGTYAGVSMARLCAFGGVPARIIEGAGNCATARFVEPLSGRPSGSSWLVAALPAFTGLPSANKSFAVMVAALDDSDCEALVSSMVGRTDNRSGFLGVRVRNAGADGLQNFGPWASIGTRWLPAPYTGGQVSSVCSLGPGRNNVGLAFR